jgi:CBS domain-containing protein
MRRLTRTIEEVGWTRDVPRLSGAEPVSFAFDAMRRDSHDCVLVIGPGAVLQGIFTSRDFLNRVAAPRISAKAVTLEEVMTPNPRTLSPSDPVAFAINWMAIEGFRNVPIVDGGKVLGVLTVWDVMRQITDMFDEIDATPRDISPQDDISNVTMIDLGGGS